MSRCPSCGTQYGAHERLCPKDGSVLEHDVNPEEQQIGRIFEGKYRLDEFLSRGGMGAVYKATHVMLDRPVAVKVIKPDLVSAPDIARRFQREARAVTHLTHPNIVNIYDFGQTDDGTLYIAMELVSGHSLKEIIRRSGPLDPARIIKLLGEVLSALSLAHKQNIIHRDLKPHNIMVTKDRDGNEIAKLLDFGIAKTFEGDTQLTATGSALGTPQYMSPEQATGKTVDARSDIYSLGIILYEMLVGEVPFNDPSTPAVLIAHMSEAPAPPSRKRPDLNLNPRLEAIALRCLEKDPNDRFQTADELGAELRRVQIEAAEPTIAIQATPPPPHIAAPTIAVSADAAKTHKVTAPTVAATPRTPPAPEPPTPTAPTIPRAAAPPVGEAPAVVPPPVPVAVPPPPAAGVRRQTQPLEQVAPPPPRGPVVAFLAIAAILLIGLAGGLYWFMSKRGSDASNVQQASTATPSLSPQTPPSTTPPPATSAAPPSEPPASSSASSTTPTTTPPSSATPRSDQPANPSAASSPGSTTPSSSAPAAPSRLSTPPTVPTPNAERPDLRFQGRGERARTQIARGRAGQGTLPEPTQMAAPPPPMLRGNTPANPATAAPAVPSVAFRCSGAPEVCTALRAAMQDAAEREGLTLSRAVAGAEVVVSAEANIVDERSESQFGTTFNIRTYSIEVTADAPRFDQAVSMSEPRTFTADSRVGRERINENARVVAMNAVERIKAYWKKRVP